MSAQVRALTVEQTAMWFGQQQVADSDVYQCAERIDIVGEFDPAVFASVVADCLSALPVVNSAFREEGEGICRFSDPRSHELPLFDVADATDPTAAVAEHVAAELAPSYLSGEISGARISGQRLLRLSETHHVWIQRIHHICIDGYSFARIIKTIADTYSARLAGDDDPAAPFVEAEVAVDSAADAEFWQGYLRGSGRPSLGDGAPSSAHRWPHRETRRLRARAKPGEHGWTELATTAVARYVSSIAGTDDVVLGMPWANRRLGAPPTVEPRVNTLPLRCTVDRTATVDDLVGLVTEQIRTVRPHAGYRAERLRRDVSAVGSDAALYGPVVNVKFFTPELRFGPARGTITNISMGPVDDVTVTVSPQPDGGLVLELETNPDRYDAASTTAHADRLAQLISAFGASVGTTPIAALPIVTDADVAQEIRPPSATAHLVAETTLGCLLAETAAAHADSVALEFTGGSVTYRELSSTVGHLAAHLSDLGAGPETVVALQLPRGPEMVIAILAAIECGAAYLPIDPELPPARIDTILDTARPVAIARPFSDDTGSRTWEFGSFRLAVTASNGSPAPARAVHPRDVAYVIFTSGSTGVPKGVMVEHRSIVNRLLWMRHAIAFTANDRVLQKTPYSFDVSVWEFFLPLISGATLVVAAPGAHRDSEAIAKELSTGAITVCHFVPTAFDAFLTGVGSRADGSSLNSLRTVVCSGEALEPDTLKRSGDLLAARVVNLYGPTEAAVDITEWHAPEHFRGDVVPIGTPVWNSGTYILDDSLNPRPIGVVGELYLAGIQLARGYLGRAALTSTRFVASPFVAGERIYATGDLVRRAADGTIEYIGRVDDQVKIRGRRIELGEITAALLTVPGVSRAVATTHGRPPSTMLVGYLVPDDSDRLSDYQARQHLSRVLPGYLVPDALVVVDDIPTTANGKLDRRQLPAPTLGGDVLTEPTSPLEMTLAAAFATAVGVDAVSTSDSFFELGGNSLSATALVVNIGELLNRDVSVADLFAAPTVIGLARRLSSHGDDDAFGRLLTLRESADGTPVFCIHPAGGLGWCYAGILPNLRRNAGVFAVQADGLHNEALPTSLHDVALDYLKTIATVAPSGPIRLVGWSVGGAIAHEIARLATESGRRVEQLVLLDSYPSEQWNDQPAPTSKQIAEAFYIMAGVDTTDAETDVLAALRNARSPLGTLTSAQVAAITTVVERFATLMREHRTGVFDGDVTLFRATRGTESFLDPTSWHGHVRGQIRQIDVDTTHPGMVHPETLAAVAAVLDGADE